MKKSDRLIAEYRDVFSKAKPTCDGEIIKVNENLGSYMTLHKTIGKVVIYASLFKIGYHSSNGEMFHYTEIVGQYNVESINIRMSMTFENISPSEIMSIIDQFRDEFFGIVNFRLDLRI